MKTLVIETSSEEALVAILEQNLLIRLEGGPSLSTHLASEIKKITSPPPTRIVLGIGPGSYTGIRVGAAIAQALCFGWNIPLFTAPSLSAYPAPVAYDARMGGVYVQLPGQAPRKLTLEEAAIELAPFPQISTPHPNLLAPRLAQLNFIHAQPNPALLAKHAVETAIDQLNLIYDPKKE